MDPERVPAPRPVVPAAHPDTTPALDTLASGGTPLLAGFCVTVIGVVAQAEERFALPGPAMLLLTTAAILLVASIHCAYWARITHIGHDDVARWESAPDPDLDPRFRFANGGRAYPVWVRRLHLLFQGGLLLLFAGLATALVPLPGSAHAGWRWVAVAACAAMLLFVSFWGFGFRLRGRLGRAPAGPLDRLARRWFVPGG